jgi:hypothetical protein
MLKRREFLKTSAFVATAASTGILNAQAQPASEPAKIERIHFVLVDEELEDSIAFAQELTARGALAFSVRDDIGRLWFGELGAAFKPGHAIAGLTSHSELLVSAEFARQHGARIRFEGAHDCRGSDTLGHSLRLGAHDESLGAVLVSADAAWPRALASRLPSLSKCEALRVESCSTTTQRTASHPGSLFSWVIA